MRNRLTILWLVVFTVLAFSINSSAQKRTLPAATSTPAPAGKSLLAAIDLPPGAVKIKETTVPAEIKTLLAEAATSQDTSKVKYRRGDSEVISWANAGNKAKSDQLIKKIESNLQLAGWKYESSKGNGVEPMMFSLVRAAPKPRRLAGFFLLKDNALFFALTELIREETSAVKVVNVAGKWNMIVEAQGQTVPVTLELEQDGTRVNGTFSSHVGDGTIEDGEIVGSTLTALAKLEVRGQIVPLKLKATISGDKMSGSLSGAGLPPISFTATKAR